MTTLVDKNRIVSIDMWRFLFALLIVWHHLPWVASSLRVTTWSPVSFFLFLSGYLSYSSNTENVKEFYVRKFFRIFPIYWISLIIAVVLTIPIRSFWTIENYMGILKNLFMLQTYFPTPTADSYLNLPSWFLSVLVLFYLLLPLLQKVQRKYPIYFILGVLLYSMLMLIGTWYVFDGAEQIRVYFPFVRLSECLLGMIFADCTKELRLRRYHKYLSVVLLLLMLVFGHMLPLQYTCPYMAIPVMAYLCVVCCKCNINRCISVSCGLLTRGGGEISMEIYMFHSLVIMALVRFMDIFNIAIPVWIEIILVYALSVGLAVLYNKLIAPHIKKIEYVTLNKIK